MNFHFIPYTSKHERKQLLHLKRNNNLTDTSDLQA